ncbi:MAG: hypothetical protein IKG87_11115 [Clostridia bacterium]|nr:hypothetical protein [Clostridia bacterium]
MSRSFGVNILLPLDGYNSDEIYATDERIQRVSEGREDGKYFKRLKIRSVYASGNDIKKYLIEKYGLSEEDFRNYSLGYNYGDWIYKYANDREITLRKAEYESLKKEHVDEGVYCLIYSHYSPEIYGSVLDQLFEEDDAVIDDNLIDKAIELIGKEYSRQEEEREEDEDQPFDNVMEQIIDYEYSMEGKLLVSLIIGREVAKRIGGMALAYYE